MTVISSTAKMITVDFGQLYVSHLSPGHCIEMQLYNTYNHGGVQEMEGIFPSFPIHCAVDTQRDTCEDKPQQLPPILTHSIREMTAP